MNNIPSRAQKWHLEFVPNSVTIPFGATSGAEIVPLKIQCNSVAKCKLLFLYKHCKKSHYRKSPDLSSKRHLHCIFQNTKCCVIIACITADRCHLLQPSNECYKQEQLVDIRGSTQHGTKTVCTFSLFCFWMCNSSDVLHLQFVYATFAENKVS